MKMCDVRFTLMGRYPSELDLSDFGITNTAVTIHGYALRAGKDITEGEFIKTKEKEISDQWNDYIQEHELKPGRNHLLILDMEPRGFSPARLGQYDDVSQKKLIKAYIRRIIVARQFVQEKWPTVKLGLYQVIRPMSKGLRNDEFIKMMSGYVRAGELGMYDFVDYLVPILYNRFGKSDVDFPAEKPKLHLWIERSTRQAITSSQKLTRRNGHSIPLAPILTFWVANGNSDHHHRVILPETMSLQLRILQEYSSVEMINLWSGPETRREMEESDWEILNFNNFLSEVDALPLPGCT